MNLSAKQFQDPDLCEKIEQALGESGAEPRLIAVKIDRDTAIIDMAMAVETTKKLKKMGVDIIIDDFGSATRR